MTEAEINGDIAMPPGRRVKYLWRNVRRNAGGSGPRPGVQSWSPRDPDTVREIAVPASPVRILMEAFIVEKLPEIVGKRNVRALDIGCGSGRMRKTLARAGFRGVYTGVDVDGSRFDERSESDGFDVTLIEADATDLSFGDKFDFVFSVSALEHVMDDRALVARCDELLLPDGAQIHLVPGPWSLPVYLWHGYRQYGARTIGERFDLARTEIYALGGVPSLLVHFVFITVGEMILRAPARKLLGSLYGGICRLSLRLDRVFSWCPPTYAIVQRRTSVDSAHGMRR